MGTPQYWINIFLEQPLLLQQMIAGKEQILNFQELMGETISFFISYARKQFGQTIMPAQTTDTDVLHDYWQNGKQDAIMILHLGKK